MCQNGHFYDANMSTREHRALMQFVQIECWPSVTGKLDWGRVVKNEEQRIPGMFNTLAILSFYFFLIYKEMRHNL